MPPSSRSESGDPDLSAGPQLLVLDPDKDPPGGKETHIVDRFHEQSDRFIVAAPESAAFRDRGAWL
jgi:hypothetical protein